MMEFTLVTVLQLFGDYCSKADVAAYPFTAELVALAESMPKDDASYEELAREAFSELVLDPEEVDYERFACFEEAMRILLFHDGRSFRALATTAELAYRHPDASGFGVNALAWLANYIDLQRYPVSESAALALKERLPVYAKNRTLAHNATACSRAIDERFGK